jgi:hypothetical protein
MCTNGADRLANLTPRRPCSIDSTGVERRKSIDWGRLAAMSEPDPAGARQLQPMEAAS